MGAAMAINGCAECLKKQREIDRLTEEIHGLRQKLRYQGRRAIEGFFGSATPSAKRPVTANTPPAKEPKRKGARPGHLGVGRYSGYNKVPCAIQYCYSHLPRGVQDLEKEFPDSAEVTAFVSTVAPQLALAMELRAQPLEDSEFARQAAMLKAQLMASMEAPAQHLGIHRIQEIFRANVDRLYHWADDRRIPAENNRAERDLRLTVIARKVSSGSQSDAGAHTRGILMSLLHTLKTRQVDVVAHLKAVLDQLAMDIHQDPFPLLFPEAPT
jgi:hypothetical protein